MDSELKPFLEVGGKIAEYLKLANYAKKEDVAFVQSVYAELIERQVPKEKTPIIRSMEEADSVANQYQMHRGKIMKRAYGYMDNPPDPESGIPNYMMIAEAVGRLPKYKSNPILAAQSGARIAEAAEKLRTGDFPEDKPLPNFEEALKSYAFLSNPEIVAKDPPYVIAAQSTEHLSKIFTAAMIAQNKPELAQDADVRRAVMAFQVYASQTLKRAGNEMIAAATGEDKAQMEEAGKTIKKSRESLHGFDKINPLSELANSTALINDMRRGFAKLGLDEKAMKLVESRLKLAEKMQHQGIAIAPFTRGQAQIDGSWLSRVKASRQSNGHQHLL